jgi:hypothetical protein
MIKTWLGRIWRAIKLIYIFLLPTRFSLLSVVIVGWAFLMSAQGADILRALVEYDPCKAINPHYLRMFAFVLATNAFAYQAWYWTRQILRVKPPARVADDEYFAVQPPPERFPRITTWMPRVVGLCAFLIPIIAFIRITLSYSDDAPTAVPWMLMWLVLSLLIFLVFVVLRRFFLRRRNATLNQRDPRNFPRSTKIVLAVTVVAALIFFVWATIDPISIGPLGSASLVFLTAALWVPIGTMLVLLGMRLRFPILAALLVWALLWSPIADHNHVIRTIEESGAGPVDNRPNAVEQVEAWYARVAPRHPEGEIPVFVVATEGGGIRAAYWTASALTAVQDSYPEFADHLFAISGVSGGSLGAAVFDALVASGPAPADPDEMACRGKDPAQMAVERKTLRYAAKQVLSFDSLTPTLAGMTQPDLAQRFLPVGFPDREQALEEAWERGWSDAMGNNDLFSKGILATLQANPRLPSLFLNGTMVETGDRIITSNTRIRPRDPNASCSVDDPNAALCEFRNAFDSFADLQNDIPFSAGGGMSARFTYVSPAGRMPDKGSDDTIAGHIVDGGYFENSGAVTAAEIVNLIRRVAAIPKHADWKRLHIYVITIDFEDYSKLCKAKPGHCGPDPTPRPFKALPGADGPANGTPEIWANEVLSPLRALLNTRGARGSQAVGDIRELVGGADVLEFRLIQREIPLPLGWLLSEQSRIEIDQATQREGGNIWALRQIGRALRVDPSKPLADPVAASAAASAAELDEEQQ